MLGGVAPSTAREQPASITGRLRVGDFFPKGSMQRTRERHYEIKDSLSYLGVAHGGESAAQLRAFAQMKSAILASPFGQSGIAAAAVPGRVSSKK